MQRGKGEADSDYDAVREHRRLTVLDEVLKILTNPVLLNDAIRAQEAFKPNDIQAFQPINNWIAFIYSKDFVIGQLTGPGRPGAYLRKILSDENMREYGYGADYLLTKLASIFLENTESRRTLLSEQPSMEFREAMLLFCACSYMENKYRNEDVQINQDFASRIHEMNDVELRAMQDKITSMSLVIQATEKNGLRTPGAIENNFYLLAQAVRNVTYQYHPMLSHILTTLSNHEAAGQLLVKEAVLLDVKVEFPLRALSAMNDNIFLPAHKHEGIIQLPDNSQIGAIDTSCLELARHFNVYTSNSFRDLPTKEKIYICGMLQVIKHGLEPKYHAEFNRTLEQLRFREISDVLIRIREINTHPEMTQMSARGSDISGDMRPANQAPLTVLDEKLRGKLAMHANELRSDIEAIKHSTLKNLFFSGQIELKTRKIAVIETLLNAGNLDSARKEATSFMDKGDRAVLQGKTLELVRQVLGGESAYQSYTQKK